MTLAYPQGFPFELPRVTPLKSLPQLDDLGATAQGEPEFFDRRHQMPDGNLCLFQRETRSEQACGEVGGLAALRRAEHWFLGHYTGHWPPDSAQSELEPHFHYGGEVLLSKAFYAPIIVGRGRFWMVPDLSRPEERLRKEGSPRIVTAITTLSSAGLEALIDARQDITNIYPWIGEEAFSPLTAASAEATSGPLDVGYWWSLDKEPEPFRDGAGFLKAVSSIAPNGDAWAAVQNALGTELSLAPWHFLALKFPGRGGEPEWLILVMPRNRKSDLQAPLLARVGRTPGPAISVPDVSKSDAQKRKEFEECPVMCLRAHGVRPRDLRLRNTGVVSDNLKTKTVALVGLGALGSTVAELLAKAGIGTFRLCDSDRLAPGNVVRHVGGIQDFGAPKTRVVASRLYSINPYVRLTSLQHGSATSSIPALAEFLNPADVAIVTTADEAVESVINEVAILHKKAVLYGRALRRADVGRVFLVRPGTDPCKACLGLYSRDSLAGTTTPADWIRIDERPTDVLLHECGRPVIPASAIDLTFIAAVIARVALDFLGDDGALQQNHFIWTRPSSPDIDNRLAQPMTTFARFVQRNPRCPTCQEPEIRHVRFAKEAHGTIVRLSEQTPNAETGGILIGYVDQDRTANVLRATEPGPKATRSARIFVRDTEYTQARLDAAALQYGKKGAYLGEWHSHLEADPRPSPLDLESMVGIARAQNYLTRCPVMIIAGVNPTSARAEVLKSWSVPIGGALHQIDNSINPEA